MQFDEGILGLSVRDDSELDYSMVPRNDCAFGIRVSSKCRIRESSRYLSS